MAPTPTTKLASHVQKLAKLAMMVSHAIPALMDTACGIPPVSHNVQLTTSVIMQSVSHALTTVLNAQTPTHVLHVLTVSTSSTTNVLVIAQMEPMPITESAQPAKTTAMFVTLKITA